MINRLEFQIRTTGVVRHLRRQLPFIESLAINNTTKAFQKVQRAHQQRAFAVRRKTFIDRSVKISAFAHKRQFPDVHAKAEILPPGGASRADILAKFESGGMKRPREGSSLALPEDVKRSGGGIIRARERPKAFAFKLHGKGPRATVFVGHRRTFLIKYRDGVTGGIYQRVGRRRKRRRGRTRLRDGRDLGIRTLYRFTPQASIDRRLKFIQNARGVVRAQFARHFHEALVRAAGSVSAAGRETRRIARADLFDAGRIARFRGEFFR